MRVLNHLLAPLLLLTSLVALSPATSPGGGDAAVERLANELRAIVQAPGWSDSRHGLMVVSLDRGDTLFTMNPDLSLAPASNMKLFTTAAALYYLGPDFRFSTYVLGDRPVSDGLLEGDLVLYGTGDPAISGRLLSGGKQVWEALADSLWAQGVREVRGDIVGDGSYFDAEWIGRGWKDTDRMAWYAAPVGALSFGENIVTVRVHPAPRAGQRARVTTGPATKGFQLVNEVSTVAKGGTTVRFEHGAEGVVVRGTIQRGHSGVVRSVPVVDPANYAAASFRSVLEERGIRIHGRTRSIHSPEESPVTLAGGGGAETAPRVLAVHLSPPLVEIARVTNHVSHNLFAEALLKSVGRIVLGEGSFEAGGRAIAFFLQDEARATPAALEVVDGSGLSRFNRATPRSAIQLLDYMARSDLADTYLETLPVAGSANGLRRMYDSPAAGNLRAKTGTIKNVSSLSGYVRTADGERLAFSIISNDVPSTWRAKRMEDAIGERLAAFSRFQPATVEE